MITSTLQKTSEIKQNKDLFNKFPWFYSNIYGKFIKCSNNFLQHNFEIRFVGISNDENTLFYGDEYFVNKIPVNKSTDCKVKISSEITERILDIAIGKSQNKFELNNLTDIEAMLVKSYILYIFKNILDTLNTKEVSSQTASEAENINFTFFVKEGNKHLGKIIISMPEYLIPEIKPIEKKTLFDISDYEDTQVDVNIALGETKLTLNEIKLIEDGDIIVLEDSNINKMNILWEDNKISFNINPDPSLIISIDSNGGKNMEEETSTKSQNMWDSILVDVVAEFDDVKLTLGELKQISEGLVIDVGSVYENKVKLRVENQVVATGELVILNDRYGVRIENVKKNKDTKKAEPAKKAAGKSNKTQQPKEEPQKAAEAAKEEDENFDYSDFEIDDESI